MKLQTEIMINASVSTVWQILTNFEAYPTWNPFIKSIKGEAKEGAILENVIHPEGGKAQTFKPTVLKSIPNQEFRWLGRLFVKGLFDGEHYFILEKVNENTTRFIHGENFSGILVNILMGMMKEQIQTSFEKMNQALKRKAEHVTAFVNI